MKVPIKNRTILQLLYAVLYASVISIATIGFERLPVFLQMENAIYDTFQRWTTIDDRADVLFSKYQASLSELAFINLDSTYFDLETNIPCIHLNPNTATSQLQETYKHLQNPTIVDYINLLRKHYILAHPTVDQHAAINQFKLAHTILQEPLLLLLHQSNRPGQLVKRLVNQVRIYDFAPSEITLIENNLQTLPLLSADVQSLLIKSKGNLKKKRQRKRGVLIVQILLVATVLSVGFLFENPYFLLYVILLMVLYKR